MKINWTSIFLFYTFFSSSYFCQVNQINQQNHTVEIDKKEPLKFHFYQGLEIVELEFPEDIKQITGSILFYRASNKDEFICLPLRVGSGNCLDIFVRSLTPGTWIVEVDWIGDGEAFLDRSKIKIPFEVANEVLPIVL